MNPSTNYVCQPVGRAIPDWKAPPPPARAPVEGHYCRVEPIDPAVHAEPLFAANALDAGQKNWTYLPYGPFTTLHEYASWLRDYGRANDPILYAIIDLARGHAVGVAAYMRIDPPNGSIEVGSINFSPLLQRTRAATKSMFLMMEHVFDLGYRRYEWKCDSLNAASRAAALRLGFRFEGIFRQDKVVKGRSRDTAWHSVIDQEWPLLRKAYQRWLATANFDAAGKQQRSLAEFISATGY